MEVVYPRCSGLDVHKRFVVACLSIVEHGQRHKELRQVSTMTSDILTTEWPYPSGQSLGQNGAHPGGACDRPYAHVSGGTVSSDQRATGKQKSGNGGRPQHSGDFLSHGQNG